MKVTDVRAVIAIGLRGQFGLRGRLPWEGNRGREYVADVERFFELTRGHVVIMGQHTFTSVPDFAFKDRDILEIHASDRPEEVLARHDPRPEQRDPEIETPGGLTLQKNGPGDAPLGQ